MFIITHCYLLLLTTRSGENVENFSQSRAMTTVAIYSTPIRKLPNDSETAALSMLTKWESKIIAQFANYDLKFKLYSRLRYTIPNSLADVKEKWRLQCHLEEEKYSRVAFK
ncbi:hypothetical protein AVEN_79484-1 [Araneus ventricosus]|uniref:Uncharacterized protein n=1 Tax=Araneus ventricosus TaxID=182803 RepID=A0A4Y2L8I3_ARAVE|nr:hypothetical protein AVEN_79484-1 [Araneus ventricosus]